LRQRVERVKTADGSVPARSTRSGREIAMSSAVITVRGSREGLSNIKREDAFDSPQFLTETPRSKRHAKEEYPQQQTHNTYELGVKAIRKNKTLGAIPDRREIERVRLAPRVRAGFDDFKGDLEREMKGEKKMKLGR